MKYLQIVMVLLVINLTAAFFDQTNIMHMDNAMRIRSDSPVDENGNLLQSDSLAYKVYTFQEEKYYLNNAQSLELQYLQSGGDFIKALFWFVDTFVKGTILIGETLRNFGVPEQIVWFYAIPVYFMYIIAIVQLVSGRSFEGSG